MSGTLLGCVVLWAWARGEERCDRWESLAPEHPARCERCTRADTKRDGRGGIGLGGRGRVSPCSGERTTTKQRGGGDKWERKIKSEAVGTGAGGPHCRSQHARWLGRAWFVPRRWHHFSRPSTWSLQRRRCAPQIPLQALRLAMQTGRASYRLARSMATGGDPPSRTPSPLPRIRKRWRTVELGGRKWGVGCLVLSENEEGRE